MVHQVLRHEATLRQDNRLGARIARRDGHDGGLAQGVNLLELRGREEGFFVAVEDLDFVGDFEFFEEPDDALRAGVIEPGGGELAICCEYASRGGGRCDTALSRLFFLIPFQIISLQFARRHSYTKGHREKESLTYQYSVILGNSSEDMTK